MKKGQKPAVCVDISENAKIIQFKHKSEVQKKDIFVFMIKMRKKKRII